jgi:hypothetical protein
MIVIPTKEELSPKPFSAGVYKGIVGTPMKLQKTKSGKDMMVAEIIITTQGPNSNEKTIGRKLFENLVIAENMMWNLDNFLKACTGRGITEHWNEGDSLEVDPFFMKFSNLCCGKEVVVVVTVEKITDGPKKGEDSNVIKEVRQVQ